MLLRLVKTIWMFKKYSVCQEYRDTDISGIQSLDWTLLKVVRLKDGLVLEILNLKRELSLFHFIKQ